MPRRTRRSGFPLEAAGEGEVRQETIDWRGGDLGGYTTLCERLGARKASCTRRRRDPFATASSGPLRRLEPRPRTRGGRINLARAYHPRVFLLQVLHRGLLQDLASRREARTVTRVALTRLGWVDGDYAFGVLATRRGGMHVALRAPVDGLLVALGPTTFPSPGAMSSGEDPVLFRRSLMECLASPRLSP